MLNVNTRSLPMSVERFFIVSRKFKSWKKYLLNQLSTISHFKIARYIVLMNFLMCFNLVTTMKYDCRFAASLKALFVQQSWPKYRWHLQLSGQFLADGHHLKENFRIPPPINVSWFEFHDMIKALGIHSTLFWGAVLIEKNGIEFYFKMSKWIKCSHWFWPRFYNLCQ